MTTRSNKITKSQKSTIIVYTTIVYTVLQFIHISCMEGHVGKYYPGTVRTHVLIKKH